MLTKRIEDILNLQLQIEAQSSQIYLAMASWAQVSGLTGISNFLFAQSNEEREHMLKLLDYINERGGRAIVPMLEKPQADYENFKTVFRDLLDHEIFVSKSINDLVDVCLQEKDYTTHNFIQWYVAEQIEEEAQARTLLDKVQLIGDDNSGLYLLDRDMEAQNTITLDGGK